MRNGSFSTSIMRWAKSTQERIHKLRKGIAIKLFNAIILDTPVLTGRLRANWQVSLDAPILSERDAEDKSGRLPMSEVESVVDKSKGDQLLYLTNNLPYAEQIEYGYSKKSPEGMVRRNVIRFGRIIKLQGDLAA
jgi:hypothetical protein